MLNYIVPPIIMITSLAALVAFLFKKFSVAESYDQGMIERLNSGEGTSISSKVLSAVSHMWLRILEKFMQRMKLFSLKMHNTSNTWFHSIKDKREKSRQNMADAENALGEISVKKEINFSEISAEKTSVQPAGRIDSRVTKNQIIESESAAVKEGNVLAEKGIFSIIRGRQKAKRKAVVSRDDTAFKKNSMEEELIRRIAVNPKDIEAYERLGDYYSDMGNLRDSAECYKQVLKLGSNNRKVRLKMRSIGNALKR